MGDDVEHAYRARINQLETRLSELTAIVDSGLANAARARMAEREHVLAELRSFHDSEGFGESGLTGDQLARFIAEQHAR